MPHMSAPVIGKLGKHTEQRLTNLNLSASIEGMNKKTVTAHQIITVILNEWWVF